MPFFKRHRGGLRTKDQTKHDRIIDAAYQLFIEQGFEEVSVQEIVERAGIAKGTFYLYFHDKDEVKEAVITSKTNELFQRAIHALHQTEIRDFEDQIVFIIDYVIDALAQNQDFLRVISKNLSLGVFNKKLNTIIAEGKQTDILPALMASAKRNHIELRNPQVLLFMIIELASATSFSCILYNDNKLWAGSSDG